MAVGLVKMPKSMPKSFLPHILFASSIMMHFASSLLMAKRVGRRLPFAASMKCLMSVSTQPTQKTISVALCQLLVGADKAANIKNAAQSIDSASGSELVVS